MTQGQQADADSGQKDVRRKGFDRRSSGTSLARVQVEIDRSQIRFFASVLELKNPIHHQVDAARERGYRDLVAPPSFFMAVEALAEAKRREAGRPTLLEAIRADFRYLLHGSERYTYFAPLCAGDRVEFATTIGDFSDKKGGALEFVTVRSEVSHAEYGSLIVAERALLHRFG